MKKWSKLLLLLFNYSIFLPQVYSYSMGAYKVLGFNYGNRRRAFLTVVLAPLPLFNKLNGWLIDLQRRRAKRRDAAARKPPLTTTTIWNDDDVDCRAVRLHGGQLRSWRSVQRQRRQGRSSGTLTPAVVKLDQRWLKAMRCRGSHISSRRCVAATWTLLTQAFRPRRGTSIIRSSSHSRRATFPYRQTSFRGTEIMTQFY